MKVNLIIDDKQLQTDAGRSILDVARDAGIEIPILCHHPALPPEGACRICLIEVVNNNSLQPACTYQATDGLVIKTNTPKVIESRKFILELLLSDHPLDCMTCDASGNCLLQDLAYEYDVRPPSFPGIRQNYPIDDPNPFVQVDRNKCILCRRCVRACAYINGVEAISIYQRGHDAHIAFGMDSFMADSPCEFCGSCVEVCPTGALYPKLSLHQGRSWQTKRVQTVCPYCGVGCQIILNVKGNKIIRVDSAWEGPSNHGWTCVKGRFGYDFVHHPDRLTKPLVRKYILEGSPRTDDRGEWVEVDWDTAIDITARKLLQIRESFGPEAIGILTSAKCTNEENYLMNKLARQVVGTNNIDHCARL